ncbi:hypothetical protein QJS10_CPB15g00738 [Acorus calamus]|uniref:Uncharacterized protein n=1 Tax=Acorus calamus TaxID=4465 RepID=A0AAV9D8H1_ACOCL|nr:hypothetical protein QJS10_CPB15g00738 [Acorus calamus]
MGETGIPLCADIKDSICHSASKTPEMVDMKSIAGASSSHEACKSSADDHVISSGEVTLGDPLYGEYDSDATQNDPDQVNGIEEVGRLQLEDDDYQYEDGEFREPLLHTWENDCEEGEAEPVDYGSDNQEIVAFDTSADYYVPAPVHSESGEYQEERLAKADHGINIVLKGDQSTYQSCLPDSAKPNLSDSGSSRKWVVSLERKVSRGHRAVSDKLEIDGKDSSEFTEDDHLAVQDGTEDDHSLRVKSSGWDQMPEGVQTSEVGINAAGINGPVRDDIGTVLDGGEPMRTIGPRLAQDLSSCIEKLKSPDMLLKDREIVRGSRSHNSDGSNDRFRRDASSCRSTGRGGPTLPRHVSGREGDHWLDTHGGHWVPNRRGSPGFYGPSGFSRSGTNAAAAAAAATAKLESSGFVITPDGTLVKAGASIMGPGSRMRRRSPEGTYRSRTRRRSPSIESDGISFSMRSGLGRGREMSPDGQFSVRREDLVDMELGAEVGTAGLGTMGLCRLMTLILLCIYVIAYPGEIEASLQIQEETIFADLGQDLHQDLELGHPICGVLLGGEVMGVSVWAHVYVTEVGHLQILEAMLEWSVCGHRMDVLVLVNT